MTVFQSQVDSLKSVVRYYDIAEKGLPEIDEDVLNILKLPKLKNKITLKNGTIVVGHKIAENLDIIILGSLIPGRFIAKSEVANWPIFGFLSKITRTIFIRRDRKASPEQIRLIKEQLDRCEKLILFPEGTSSDGRRVLPFKSPLFDAAMLTNSIVQPITIRYTHLNGIPVGYSSRSLFGWYGDMDLRPHLWNALSLGIFTIEVVFHEPIRADQFSNRKKLAVYCQKTVAKGL